MSASLVPDDGYSGSDSDSTTYSEYAEDSPSKRHKCTFPDCDKAFFRPGKLAEHLRRHTNERPFICQYLNCNKTYHKKEALKRHEHRFHLQKVENAMCPIDGCMQVMRKNSLRKHILRKHNSFRQYKFYCEECQKGFRTKFELEDHLNKHEIIYRCDVCQKVFSQGHRYRRHINSHKEYKCLCKAEFMDHNLYRSHKKGCEFHQPYCSMCGKKFRTKSNLKQHLSSVHTKNTLPTFKCTEEGCSKSYLHQRNLQTHIREFHQGLTPQLEREYTWICEICQKIFKKGIFLKRHQLNIHMNPKAKKKARQPRFDKGIPIVPMVTQLTGIELSKEEKQARKKVDRELIQRELELKTESNDSSNQTHTTIESALNEEMIVQDASVDQNSQDLLSVNADTEQNSLIVDHFYEMNTSAVMDESELSQEISNISEEILTNNVITELKIYERGDILSQLVSDVLIEDLSDINDAQLDVGVSQKEEETKGVEEHSQENGVNENSKSSTDEEILPKISFTDFERKINKNVIVHNIVTIPAIAESNEESNEDKPKLKSEYILNVKENVICGTADDVASNVNASSEEVKSEMKLEGSSAVPEDFISDLIEEDISKFLVIL